AGCLARGPGLDAIELPGETRDLARSGIAMDDALGGGLSQHLHRFLQGFARLLRVAAERFLRALDRAVNMRFYRAIAHPALEAAAMALDGRRMIWNVWHNKPSKLTIAQRAVNLASSGRRADLALQIWLSKSGAVARK